MNKKTDIKVSPVRKKKRFWSKEQIELTVLSLPAIIMVFIFQYLPIGGLVMAFKNFNANLGIWKSPWNGLENFKFFFGSQDAFRVLRNTVLFGIDFQVLGIVFALMLALFLYEIRSKIALKTIQTMMILPHFISYVLVAFITYALLNLNSGVLNSVIIAFGGERIDWYADYKYWPYILTVVDIWKKVGMDSIIYYAALIGIDESLFEAARLDGASKWQEIRYIKIPELKSVISILLILGIGKLISGDFGLFYQVPMDIGVLYPVTDIVNTYVFRGLQQATNLGMTAAVGLFQSVVSLILVVGSNLIVKKLDPDQGLF